MSLLTPTKYWHKLDDGRIQCDLCPRFCKMRNGQRGLCYVRGIEDGQVVLTSYGYASGFCIDPVEKKPLNHFLPGTPILSFGQFGCNLTCKFCQNWDISKAREFDRLNAEATPQVIAEAARQTKCKSVAFTYNDPVIFLEYAVDIAKACHARSIKTVAVTAGYICKEPRSDFFQHMDAANIDLKCFSDDFYSRLCSGHLQPVLNTLKYLKHETSTWFEITTLLIPGENDSPAEISDMTNWIVDNLGPDVPLHFSAFHPDWKMTDKQNTPLATLQKARKIALKNGMWHVYIGNAHDPEADSTYCHQCGEMLIGRDWYQLSTWNLDDDGNCIKCGSKCSGVFDGPPGSWGRKRVQLKIG